MTNMKQILTLPIIFALFLIPCLAQQTKNQSIVVEELKPFDVKDYEGWQKVELNALTFYIPSILKRKEVKCYDGGCYHFESDDLLFRIDLDPAAGRPTFERTYPSYSDKITQIDGKYAWIWFFQDEGDYKYLSGVNFWDERSRKYGAGIYLSSKTTDTKQMAEKIFRSIKFNPKPKL
jgi:hypothetical protein